MRILTNELISAKMLRGAGFSSSKSEAIVSMISNSEIYNIYSKNEIDEMLSKSIEKVFDIQDEKLKEQRREFDESLKAQHRDLDEKILLLKEQLNKEHDEAITSRRWLIGTIITVGMGLAAYLSALIKISH